MVVDAVFYEPVSGGSAEKYSEYTATFSKMAGYGGVRQAIGHDLPECDRLLQSSREQR